MIINENVRLNKETAIFKDCDSYMLLNDKYVIITKSNIQGIFTLSGKTILEPNKYTSIKFLGDDLFFLKSNAPDKYLFNTLTGEKILLRYDNVYPFSNKYLKVRSKDRYGFIDKLGNEIVKPIYSSVRELKDGLAGIRLNGRYGFIDENLNVKIKPKYDNASYFSSSICSVNLKGNECFIDKVGNLIIKPRDVKKIGSLQEFHGDLAIFTEEYYMKRKFGLINKESSVVLNPVYDYIFSGDEDIWVIVRHGKYGLANNKGEVILEPTYDNISVFKYNLASVQIGDKFGFIGKSGKVIIEPIYDSVTLFEDGYSLVLKDGVYSLIDITGTTIFSLEKNMIKENTKINKISFNKEITNPLEEDINSKDSIIVCGNYIIIDKALYNIKDVKYMYDLLVSYNNERISKSFNNKEEFNNFKNELVLKLKEIEDEYNKRQFILFKDVESKMNVYKL